MTANAAYRPLPPTEHLARRSDRELVARCGQAPALAELLRRHGGAVHAHFLRCTDSPARARALTRETFRHVYRARADFPPDTPFQAWALTIAGNVLHQKRNNTMLQTLLPRNEHTIDRAVRVALGLGLLSMVAVGPKTLWGLVGLVPLLTGALGSCPLYTLFGVSTCGLKATD